MEDENLSVNTQEVANPVDQQVSTQEENSNVQEQQVNNTQVENATQQTQTPEQNAVFAKVRREAEQRAMDKVVAEMEMEWNGKPITTYSQYQAALREKQSIEKAQQMGIDPQFYSEFEQMKQQIHMQEREKTFMQQENQLMNDPVKGQLYSKWKDDIYSMSNSYNVDLRTAFTLLLDERLGDILGQTSQQATQDTIRKINSNAVTTPGALGSEIVDTKASVKDMSKEDFGKLLDRVKRGEKIEF